MIMRWPLEKRNTACLARRDDCSMVLPRSVLIRRGLETWRSTSVFLSSTRAMRHPSRRGAISRTIVSTSGSSGTLDLAPGDVAPPGLAFERNPLGAGTTGLRGDRHRRAETGDAQDSPPIGAQPPPIVAECAGVKDDHTLARLFDCRGAGGGALPWVVGGAAGGQNGGGRSLGDGEDLLSRERVPAALRDCHDVFGKSG